MIVRKAVVQILASVLIALGIAGGGCPSGGNPGDSTAVSATPSPLNFGSTDTELTLLIEGSIVPVETWSCQPSEGWVTVTPASGTGDAQVKVAVDRANLDPGAHTASIAVTTNLGNTTAQVTLTVLDGTGLSGQLAFASNRSGNFDIYLMNVRDKSVQALVSSAGDDINPTWSPLGELAYASNRSGNFDIYGPGSSTPLIGTGADENYPSWSPDGTRLAFLRQEMGLDEEGAPLMRWNLYVYSFDTGAVTRLNSAQKVYWTPHPGDDGDGDMIEYRLGPVRPAWSPDSSKLYVGCQRKVAGVANVADDLLEFDADNPAASAWALLVNGGIGYSALASYADVAPDGIRIALAGYSGLSVIGLDGQPVDPILPGGASTNAAPCWTADGARIAYAMNANGNQDIYVTDTSMTATATGMVYLGVQLTDDAAEDQTPVWKPPQ